MLLRAVSAETAPRPSGSYSPAVIAGGMCWVAGMGPYDPDSRAVVGTTVAEQTVQTLRNIEAVLLAAGCRLSDIVSSTVYLADLGRDWAAFDAAYGSVLAEPYPARTTIGASLKGILVEIAVVAQVRAGA